MMLLPLFIIGCRYDLVDEPSLDYNEHKTAADYSDFILPPSKITASHGESKAVTISWEAVENAVQYQIFAAENPFSTFSKVSETKGTETEILIEEESGITKYYCVSAVNYYGTVSSKSIVVCGSTLAVPIITAIEPSEEGNAVKLSWWMDNCSDETYENSVSYNINVYNVTNQTIKFKSLEAEGNLREVNIDGLASTTEYLFEVEVVKADSTAKECSEKTSAETAHRVIPDKPVDFAVSQGDSKDSIKLSWKLPEGCWYRENSGVSGFVLHPLSFYIYRKLDYQDDSEFELVKIACIEADNTWKNRKSNETNYYLLEIPNYDTHENRLQAPYEKYVPGEEVSWEDTTVERGKKYKYFIQTITDDTPKGKIITSDSSKTALLEGWRLSIPNFSIQADYIKEGDKFTEISFAYEAAFETFGKQYTYYIEIQHSDLLETTTVEEDPVKFTNLETLNTNKCYFNSLSDEEVYGYYSFTLHICKDNSSDKSEPIDSVKASGKYLVTDDANAIPVIENFELKDGYSNHFELSWKYNPSYSYIIHWKDNGLGEEQIEEIPEDSSCFDGKNKDDIVVFNHNANSGDRRVYSIVASNGLTCSPVRPNGDIEDKIYETLGTAEPSITSYEYDKICIEWDPVQKSNGNYIISAKYDEENAVELVSDNVIITAPEKDDDNYKCVINQPDGYNDALKSGKRIKLTVTSLNDITNDTTVSEPLGVCTVGPALTNVSVGGNKKYADHIEVKWNIIEGAKGYIIRRFTYKMVTQNPADETGDFLDYPDIYYFDGTNLTKDGDVVDSKYAKVTSFVEDGYFKLIDNFYSTGDDANRYEQNQSLINWGIPFGYVVIPVKDDGNYQNDFVFDHRIVSIKNGESYINLLEQFGSTNGFGFNVHAQKSDRKDIQVVEWAVPYNQFTNPSVYYRDSESTDNKWKKITATPGAVSNGKQSASFTPDSLSSAYEYIVVYGTTSSELNDYVPVSFLEDSEIGLSAKDTVYNYTGLKEEKSNKGYLLYMDFSAYQGEGDGYTEVINFNEWDYDYRSIGPENAFVRIKNYNISPEWVDVAELDKNLCFSKSSEAENVTARKVVNTNYVEVEPTILMDGTTTNPITKGYLQVLRDAKHYYSLVLKKGTVTSEIGNEENVYAYRNINEYEFAKMIMLLFAEGMNKVGKLGFESKTITDDGDGKIELEHINEAIVFGLNTQLSKDYSFKFTNYSPSIRIPFNIDNTNNFGNFLKISCQGVCYRKEDGVAGYPKSFDQVTITASKVDNSLPESYTGYIMFLLSSYENGTINSGSKIIPFNSKEKRRVFVPFQLHDDEKRYDEDSSYGWWTE